jgi:hypothetical protein
MPLASNASQFLNIRSIKDTSSGAGSMLEDAVSETAGSGFESCRGRQVTRDICEKVRRARPLLGYNLSHERHED